MSIVTECDGCRAKLIEELDGVAMAGNYLPAGAPLPVEFHLCRLCTTRAWALLHPKDEISAEEMDHIREQFEAGAQSGKVLWLETESINAGRPWWKFWG